MSKKKVYFYQIKLKRKENDTYCSNVTFKERFEEILLNRSVTKDNIMYLDVTEHGDEYHSYIELIKREDNIAFMRFAKQRSRNGIQGRNYKDGIPNTLLKGNDESVNGIESVIYAYINYETQIIEIAAAKRGFNENILKKAFLKYDNIYFLEILSIPNQDTVESLYDANHSKVRKLELQMVRPNNDFLANVLHWNSDIISEIIQDDSVKISLVVSPSERGSYISTNQDGTRTIIDTIRSLGSDIYNRVFLYGKNEDETTDLRKYNFYEDNFGYNINVDETYIEGGTRHSYSKAEIIKSYFKEMEKRYNDNSRYFYSYLCAQED